MNQILMAGATLFLAIACSCSKSEMSPYDPPQIPQDWDSHKLHYLALGDSYTVGEGVDRTNSFPAQLVAKLRERGEDFASPLIVAQTGWTTSDLQGAVESGANLDRFDLVTLLIGVNNQYRGEGIAKYPSEFERLAREALALVGGDKSKIIVLSIPDWGATPFVKVVKRDPKQVAKEIERFNLAAKRICDGLGVRFVDITPLTTKLSNDSSMLARDGLHPSGKLYAEWVKLLMRER